MLPPPAAGSTARVPSARKHIWSIITALVATSSRSSCVTAPSGSTRQEAPSTVVNTAVPSGRTAQVTSTPVSAAQAGVSHCQVAPPSAEVSRTVW